MGPRRYLGEGADVTGEGEDFQNFKMALRAFRIGATYWMFKVLWVRVGIWARLGKFSRFTYFLRYFGSASVFGPALVNFPGFSFDATYWMFEVLSARVDIWARIGKFSRLFFHTFRIGVTCWMFKVLRARVVARAYLRTRAGIGAQARSRPIRGNSNRVFDDDL